MNAALERIALSARVAMIYVPSDNKTPEILLVREKPEKSRGAPELWTIPGGGHKQRKDRNNIEITAAREFFEETGIELSPNTLDIGQSYVHQGQSLEPRFQNHVVHAFLVVTRHKQDPSPQDDDILEAKWFPLSRLPNETAPEGGVPLSSSSWRQLGALLKDRHYRQLLHAAGVNEKRIQGIFTSWKKRQGLKLTPA